LGDIRRAETYQVVGQTAKGGLQTLDDVGSLLVEVEGSTQDEKNTGDLVGVMEVDPGLKLLSERRRRDAGEPDLPR
jgi:hypothetical protein